MDSPEQLSQKLQAIQRNIKQTAEGIHTREDETKITDLANFKLDQDMKNTQSLIQKEQQKIQQLEQAMNEDKKKKDENTKLIAKAKLEILRLKGELTHENSDLQETERQYKEAVASRGKQQGPNNGTKHY